LQEEEGLAAIGILDLGKRGREGLAVVMVVVAAEGDTRDVVEDEGVDRAAAVVLYLKESTAEVWPLSFDGRLFTSSVALRILQ